MAGACGRQHLGATRQRGYGAAEKAPARRGPGAPAPWRQSGAGAMEGGEGTRPPAADGANILG